MSRLEFFLHPRYVHVQLQPHSTFPQLLPVGVEANPGVGREQDNDDEHDAGRQIKPVHEKDENHHKAHRNQN